MAVLTPQEEQTEQQEEQGEENAACDSMVAVIR